MASELMNQGGFACVLPDDHDDPSGKSSSEGLPRAIRNVCSG